MKMHERIRSSLFLKIILLFLVTHLFIASVGFGIHRYFNAQRHQKTMMRSITHHSHLLANNLSAKSDTTYARALSDTLVLQIRYNLNGQHWQSHPETPEFALAASQSQSDSTWMDGRSTVVEFRNQRGHFLFAFDTEINRDLATMKWRILFAVAFLMFILTMLYLIIRRVLSPIRDLDRAAVKLSAGNLNVDLQTNRCDELGDLMRSFNDMAERIKAMLKARDQLLLDASHELRSPLTRIKVVLEFLPQETSTENIRDDIKEMETMLTELLESERLDSPHGGLHIHFLDLPVFARSLAEDYPADAVHLTLPADGQHLTIEADAERLKMALGNIIANALKYGQPDQKAVEIKLTESDDSALFEISDFGPGIPEADLPFIFEPFYRVDKSRAKNTGGYGLGLSLAKKIIETHGGSIRVESGSQSGCTFTICLPKKLHQQGETNV